MITRIVILFFFLSIIYGCTKQELFKQDEQITQGQFKPISQKEIQKNLKANIISNWSEALSSNEGFRFLPSQVSALVDSRTNSYLTLEHVSEIPVTFNKKVHYSGKNETNDQDRKSDGYSCSFLVFSKKSDNVLNSAIMTIVSETEIKDNNIKKGPIFYKSLSHNFTGIVLFHDLDSKFIVGWQYNKGKVIRRLNREIAQFGASELSRDLSEVCDSYDSYTVTKWCTDCTDWYYNGVFSHTDCSVAYTCGQYSYQSCSSLPSFSNYTSGGSVLQGGFSPADEGVGMGRQPLCPESIVFQSLNDNHYRETNLRGLLFIDPTNEKSGNKFDIYLGCTNYITVDAMDRMDNNRYFNDGLSPARRILEYHFARELFDADEIRKIRTLSGEEVWQFSYYATQVIAASTANIVAFGIVAQFGPLASEPSNTYIKTNFVNYYQDALQAFIPGSRTSATTRAGVLSSNVKYGTSLSPCQ